LPEVLVFESPVSRSLTRLYWVYIAAAAIALIARGFAWSTGLDGAASHALWSIAALATIGLGLGIGLGIGIGHGFADLALARSAMPESLIRFVALYLLGIIAFMLLWAAHAPIALAIFIGISAIHFAIDGARDERHTALTIVAGLIEGGAGALAPIVSQLPETAWLLHATAFAERLPTKTPSYLAGLASIGQAIFWGLLALLAIYTLLQLALARSPQQRKLSLGARVTRCVVLACMCVLPWLIHPLVAFLLYFTALHALRHIAKLPRFLTPTLHRVALREVILGGAGVAIIAICGLIAYQQMPQSTIILTVTASSPLVLHWLIGIGAALVLPHTWVVWRWTKNARGQGDC
jgi:Brp/Blh family beta-carotene 15,15'-monooxygenase